MIEQKKIITRTATEDELESLIELKLNADNIYNQEEIQNQIVTPTSSSNSNQNASALSQLVLQMNNQNIASNNSF